ncbi:glycosyltransferase family 4 protein [Motilimonas sp. KMU-193]|uniref:glycosyltransferase family 4 protein n=1 Tax=Motilimonas sp. KMU-193 TaxID=3388668 RepID=UPI00396B1E36
MIYIDLIINKLQSHGGISVYFNELTSRLSKENIKVTFLNEKNDKTSIFERPLKWLERYRSVKINSKKGVLHSSYYRVSNNKEIKLVNTVHDFTYEKFIKGPAKWIHCWQKYRAILRSDIVICVSQNTANDLFHYCPIEASKVRVIYNGVSEIYSPLNLRERTNEVLFVGARAGYKNFSLAVEAVAKIPDLSLSIVGGGMLSKNETRLLEHHLPGRYQWLGRLSDNDLNVAYNRAYALLYPSSYEGFGIPILEAMRAGCPVIAVNVSSIPEVAGDAAVLTPKADTDLFVDALKSVASRRESLMHAGFEQAKLFSWDKCYIETLQVYKELMQ